MPSKNILTLSVLATAALASVSQKDYQPQVSQNGEMNKNQVFSRREDVARAGHEDELEEDDEEEEDCDDDEDDEEDCDDEEEEEEDCDDEEEEDCEDEEEEDKKAEEEEDKKAEKAESLEGDATAGAGMVSASPFLLACVFIATLAMI
jgi:hypothetical protein